jgi:hypothetical protein
MIMEQIKTDEAINSTVVQSGSLELREIASNVNRLLIHNGSLRERNHAQQLVLYVPTSARQEILRMAHPAAHQLADETGDTLKILFWWP